MRLLLNVDRPGDRESFIDNRQQITPDMRFTCDGMITKWIIGASSQSEEDFLPELQVWRNIGNGVYQKINGTFIEPSASHSNSIYEYDGFSPIPIKSGDILGIFLPRRRSARLLLQSESTNSPTNYYISTDSSTSESPYDVIDIESGSQVRESSYHPMVTVEIGKRVSCVCTRILLNVLPSLTVRDTTSTKSSTTRVSEHTWYSVANVYYYFLYS